MRNLTTNCVESQGVDETLTKQFDELINKVRELTAQQCTAHSAGGGLSRRNEEDVFPETEDQHEPSR